MQKKKAAAPKGGGGAAAGAQRQGRRRRRSWCEACASRNVVAAAPKGGGGAAAGVQRPKGGGGADLGAKPALRGMSWRRHPREEEGPPPEFSAKGGGGADLGAKPALRGIRGGGTQGRRRGRRRSSAPREEEAPILVRSTRFAECRGGGIKGGGDPAAGRHGPQGRRRGADPCGPIPDPGLLVRCRTVVFADPSKGGGRWTRERGDPREEEGRRAVSCGLSVSPACRRPPRARWSAASRG